MCLHFQPLIPHTVFFTLINILSTSTIDLASANSVFIWLIARSAETIVSVKYSHFLMKFFWQLTAASKCTSISIEIAHHILGCIIFKMAYSSCSLRQSLPPVLRTSSENSNLKHSDYPSIYIAVLLAVQEFLAREHCVNVITINIWKLKCVFYCGNCANEQKIQRYTSMKLKTTFSDLIFTVPFTLSFWLSFL